MHNVPKWSHFKNLAAFAARSFWDIMHKRVNNQVFNTKCRIAIYRILKSLSLKIQFHKSVQDWVFPNCATSQDHLQWPNITHDQWLFHRYQTRPGIILSPPPTTTHGYPLFCHHCSLPLTADHTFFHQHAQTLIN